MGRGRYLASLGLMAAGAAADTYLTANNISSFGTIDVEGNPLLRQSIANFGVYGGLILPKVAASCGAVYGAYHLDKNRTNGRVSRALNTEGEMLLYLGAAGFTLGAYMNLYMHDLMKLF